jgi:hypothetical protein
MSGQEASPLNGLPDLSEALGDAFEEPGPGFRPWEQRVTLEMGAVGGGQGAATVEEPAKLARACQEVGSKGLVEMIERQTDLIHYPMVDLQTTPNTDLVARPDTNEASWRLFLDEQLYDTRRVTLEHVHVFEWFPIAPGKFHTSTAKRERQVAYSLMERTAGGDVYYSPLGKASMVQGGIGTVRLRPRQIDGEPHYFMTASSNGVCHEGFPILVPRRFYGSLKPGMLRDGAVPVTLSGEMRYVSKDAVTFTGQSREVPLLYLHVDELEVLPAPRSEVTEYLVTVAVTFVGRFEGREGAYVTFASFDPAQPAELKSAIDWLESVYVEEQHRGTIVTDFDEVRPRFPNAVFGLPDLMAGKLDRDKVRGLLDDHGLNEKSTRPFYLIYHEINTHGGAYVEGDVYVDGGDFVGRDQHK